MGRTSRTSKFTERDIKQLEENPNVKSVSEKNISYSPTFKLAAIQAYNNGQTPMEIFLEAGFNVNLIGLKTPNKCLHRWRNIYSKYGESGLSEERRGKGGIGRKPSNDLSIEQKLKRAEAKIKLLEAENDLLKKLDALERHSNHSPLSSSERFQLINHTIRLHGLKRVTRYLCELAEVSTSGYYRWLHAEEYRQQQADADERDFLLINKHFDALKGRAGALVIKMRLERLDGIVMNHKKIRRLMRKYHLVAKIRTANPYRKMAKATHEHQTCPNFLERQFDQGEPEKVLLTDITYLRYENQWAYLSCIKDGATKQILAHYLSPTLELSIVEHTLKRLIDRLDGNIHPEAIFHSDQGMHYTHPKTRHLVKKLGLKQSMSRKGNCWDNASMETFFGHMKDELEYRDCKSFEELRVRVSEYIAYYNSERYQWKLKKMTPDEFRSHLLTA